MSNVHGLIYDVLGCSDGGLSRVQSVVTTYAASRLEMSSIWSKGEASYYALKIHSSPVAFKLASSLVEGHNVQTKAHD